MSNLENPATGDADQARGAVHAIACFAADEFERIAALGQALQALMRQPRFYAAPWIAAAQISAICELSERAAANVDQMAEGVGIARDRSELQQLLDAQEAFAASRSN